MAMNKPQNRCFLTLLLANSAKGNNKKKWKTKMT